jgi:large subunit ribosomal protein L2
MAVSYIPPIWRHTAIRRLTFPMLKLHGHNNRGRITTFHRGAGSKRRFRNIDFQRYLFDIPAQLIRIEKDPFRNAPIALIHYSNGILSYILAINGLMTNNFITSGPNSLIDIGNNLPIKNIPLATLVHAISSKNSSYANLVRSAGTKAQILRKVTKSNFIVLKLPSNELRLFHSTTRATIGIIEQPFLTKKTTKAGNLRWKGRRPTVRGVAMNPIDHPHGGGEGKTSGGRPSCSPWGILTKGVKTRPPRKQLTHIIKRKFK